MNRRQESVGPARATRRSVIGVATAAAATSIAVALGGCSTGPDASSGNGSASQSSAAGADAATEAVRDCLLAEGWDVEIVVDPAGNAGIVAEYPDDQQSQYDAALAGCQAASGWGEDAPALTAEEAGAYFDALTETSQCLSEQGFDTPPAPSRQAFIDAATRGEFIWDPYANFFEGQDVDIDELMRAEQACPLPAAG